MNIHNATPFAVAYNAGLQKSGRNCLIIVVKATYDLPLSNSTTPQLAEEQIKPFDSDAYSGEPGLSAPLYENDFATYKPRCDVILHASAYSQEPVTEKKVGFKIGTLEKVINVVGQRRFIKVNNNLKISNPTPFTQQKISYDTAYGGREKNKKTNDKNEETYTEIPANLVGIGFYPNSLADELEGKPLPLTETPNITINDITSKKYIPESFGPIARNWYPRNTMGGTYDSYWNEHTKPFLPNDFDEGYYQCTPPNQQLPHLRGGEDVMLIGLSPQHKIQFKIPTVSVPMQAILSNGNRHNLNPVIDTLIIEPDENRFTLVWRARIALKRSIHEVDLLIAGKPTRGWERARMMDKLYLPLTQLTAFKQRMKKRLAEEERLRQLNNNDNTDLGNHT